MRGLLKTVLSTLAIEFGKAVGLYRRFCSPDGTDWAEFLRRHGGFHQMGDHCSIQTNVTFTDPQYVRMGNNVRLSGCTLFGHDGSVNMLNRAYQCNIDRVGPIDLRDNVFVGHGAIVLPSVSIGPNSVVAAGAVVTRDVPPHSIVAGVPARVVGDLDDYVEKRKAETETLPWRRLLDHPGRYSDASVSSELDRLRIESFFGSADSRGHNAEKRLPEAG